MLLWHSSIDHANNQCLPEVFGMTKE